MANISQRLKNLESQMIAPADKKKELRAIVKERLISLFHNHPEKETRWEKFKALYLHRGVSKLSDLSPQGLNVMNQIFID